MHESLAPVPTNYDPKMLECEGTATKCANSFFDDIAVMIAMAKQGLAKTKDVRAFYRSQAGRLLKTSTQPAFEISSSSSYSYSVLLLPLLLCLLLLVYSARLYEHSP